MQRASRQSPLVASREKSQPWSSSSARRTSTLNELELRVCTAEKTNQQILNDIAELRQDLKLGHSLRTGITDSIDSDGPADQDCPHRRKEPQSSKTLPIQEALRQAIKDNVLQKLTTDVQTVCSRVGNQAVDIQNLYQELRNCDLKLENLLQKELRATQAEASLNSARSESNTTNKNRALPKDSALERFESSVAQIETKVKQLHSDRLRFENNIHNSLLDQATRLGETEKFMKDSVAEIRSLLRDNAQEILSLRKSVRSELDGISNHLNERVSTALEKLQDELATSQTDHEAALGRFSLANSGYESRLAELENVYKNVVKGLPEELNEIREEQQTHQKKLLHSLGQLDLAVEVLEQGLSEEKEQLKGVVAAEIKARTSNIFSMQAKLRELEDNVNSTSSKLNSFVSEIQEKLTRLANQSGSARPSRGASADVSAVTKRIDGLEKEIDNLQAGGQRNTEDIQTALQNIAEAIQAVKVGLLVKIEKIEEETNEAIRQLTRGINDLKVAKEPPPNTE